MPQKVGGLDLAIRSLRSYLAASCVSVKTDTSFAVNGTNSRDAVVHFHGLWQPKFLKPSQRCRAAKIPYMVSPHGMLEPWAWKHKRWKKWPYFMLFERRFLRRANLLLAAAQPEAEHLRARCPGVRVETLPPGTLGGAGPE